MVFAKSNPLKTIQEHTREVIEKYTYLKTKGYLQSEFVEQCDTVMLKVLTYHDYGKLNYKFQNKIQKNNQPGKNPRLDTYGEIPHEWLSIAFISKEDRTLFRQYKNVCPLFFSLIRYCIGFHHNRNMSRYNKQVVLDFITYDLEQNKNELAINYELYTGYNLKTIEQQITDADYFQKYLKYLVFVKGILHKCDYTASGDIAIEKPYKGNYEKDFSHWVSGQKWKTLRDYQVKVKQYKDKSIIFIASTGAGKTEYAMNWINGSKAFYLLGLRTAVNAMYERFKDIFTKDNVALLHGNTNMHLLEDQKEKENPEEFFTKLNEIYQLSFPLTIATADQIITAVFKYNSFERIYLTASYSKIIMDEIQSFTPQGIACIITFLKEIHNLGGRFLLMTATLPQFIKDEFLQLNDIEIPKSYFSPLKRHKIQTVNEFINSEYSLDLIKKSAAGNKKILIICNTIKKAQEIFSLLEDLHPHLLHSKFIQKDRYKKELQILNEKKPGIWISTQIVEASLNIDFDMLFTECSSIDSLLQRFGRCFRTREYNEILPNIYIFTFSDISRYIYDIHLLQRTQETVLACTNQILNEEMKQEIIDHVFNLQYLKTTKYYESYKNYRDLLALGFKSKSKTGAQKLFRTFTESHTVIPFPVYEKHEQEIHGLINSFNKVVTTTEKLKIKKNIFNYCVSLSLYKKQKELLECINPELHIFVLHGVHYSDTRGLSFIESYKPEHEII